MNVTRINIEVRKTTLKEESDDLKNTTPQQRWAMMWQLAKDAWAFKGEQVAEPGFHRHIVRIYRRKG